MAHKVLQPITVTGAAVESETVLPSFTFAPFAGRSPLDDVKTDLVLMTKLYRHDIPAALHVHEPDVAHLLKTTIKEEFEGKRGEVQLLQVPLENSDGRGERYVLLFGLGEQLGYKGNTSCLVFETLFQQALELGVKHVTVPFIPNPMTKNQLSHRATAFKMKHVLKQVLAAWKGPVALKEITLYCSPAAVRHLQTGLQIEQGEGCPCEEARSQFHRS